MIFILLALIHLFLLTHLQFTAWPEMVSFPYLFIHGFRLYTDFSHPYQPLLTLILSAVYSVFGFHLPVLQIFTWSIILINDWLVYLLNGKKLIPLAIYIFLQPVFEGNQLWFDLALTPLILCSFFFLQKKQYFLTGLFFALGLLVKQQAILLLIPVLIYFFYQRITKKQFFSFISGGALPVVIVLSWILKTGTLSDYIFWTFVFPLKWLPHFQSYPQFPSSNQVALLGTFFVLLIFSKKRFLTSLTAVSFLMAFPRFSYFHLQPWLALYTLALAPRRLTILHILVLGGVLWWQTRPLFSQPTRFWDTPSISFAKLISDTTPKDKAIYLLGPHSLLYVLSDRLPPKPWHDNFVWYMDIPGIQEELLSGWAKDPPALIFAIPPKNGPKNALGVYQPQSVVDYLGLHYNKQKTLDAGEEVWLIK